MCRRKIKCCSHKDQCNLPSLVLFKMACEIDVWRVIKLSWLANTSSYREKSINLKHLGICFIYSRLNAEIKHMPSQVLYDSKVNNHIKFKSFFWNENNYLNWSDCYFSTSLNLVQVSDQDYQICVLTFNSLSSITTSRLFFPIYLLVLHPII